MYQGKKHVLRGTTNHLKSTKAKIVNKIEGGSTQFYMLTLTTGEEEGSYCHYIQAAQGDPIAPELSDLIDRYASIFALPSTLPPHIGAFDHRIPLIEGANPVNKRPYRYPGSRRISLRS